MPAKTPTTQKHPTLRAGSRVVLLASRGPRPTPPAQVLEVPAVVPMSQTRAVAHLHSAGFRERIVGDSSGEHARGVVEAQMPEAGTRIAAGSEVVLLVSLGKAEGHAETTALPEVVGEDERQAVEELKRAKLEPVVVRDYNEAVEPGRVVAQLPDAEWLAEHSREGGNVLIVAGVVIAVIVVVALAVLVWLR